MNVLKCGFPFVLSTAMLLICFASPARATWPKDGTALCTAPSHQHPVTFVSDGAGGAIAAWVDWRSGPADYIYAQRVTGSGNVLWMTDGIPLCTAMGTVGPPSIVSDGAAGAIVTWHDWRSGTDADIYVQRIDHAGTALWTTDGVALCTATGNQHYPKIASDGAGGAIVTWEDWRSGSCDIYAQRIDASGTVLWTADGVELCTAALDQWHPSIASDGAAGAIVAWEDHRSGEWDIYAQRVNASGDTVWMAQGVPLCIVGGGQEYPTMESDGVGGTIVTWQDNRTSQGIYAQRVDASGTVQWTADGVGVCTATGAQTNPTIVSDGASGAIIAWEDDRSGDYDIYSRRIDASGMVQWTPDGVALCTVAGTQAHTTIVSDAVGGAIVAWNDQRSPTLNDIYTQRVDASGTVIWSSDGVALSTAPDMQSNAVLVSDGAGGAIAAWYDSRGATYDVYAQRVTRQGYWGYPAPKITSIQDVPGDQGGQVRISFDASRLDAWPDLAATHYSIWRALSPSDALAMKTRGVSLPSPGHATTTLVGKACYTSPGGDWELIGTMDAHLLPEYGYTATTLRDSTSVDSGWEYYFVSAHGSETFDFWDSSPDSGYSVDNLSPCAPAALAAEYIGDFRLHMHWSPNTEVDLSHYAIYRGTGPEFVPDEINRVGTATDSSFVDEDFGYGEYYYKVSAIDVHGNESQFSLLSPDMITGTPGGDRPHSNLLFQNAPNPFLLSTRIAFSIKEEGHVRLLVFDAKGRLVRLLVDAIRGPNRYVEVWDGRDECNRQLPSGTYFYRLELPGWSDSRKVTLAK